MLCVMGGNSQSRDRLLELLFNIEKRMNKTAKQLDLVNTSEPLSTPTCSVLKSYHVLMSVCLLCRRLCYLLLRSP